MFRMRAERVASPCFLPCVGFLRNVYSALFAKIS